MIQFSSRGYLYAPNRKTRAMWRNIRMMKTLAPQRCMPRTSQPSVRSFGDVWIDCVGLVRVRLVVHREDHAGDRLDEERGQRRRAERVHQLMSRGTLRKRKYLTPPTSPERSSSQSSGYIATCRSGSRFRPWLRRRSPSVRRLDGVEHSSRPVDVLARARRALLVDLRLRARAVDLATTEYGLSRMRWPLTISNS